MMFLLAMLVFYTFSSALIKKLLMLELMSMLMLMFIMINFGYYLVSIDMLFILMTFLVIDAVLGLSLLVAMSRKSGNYLKINKAFWLCS